jgi:hypothetical protein
MRNAWCAAALSLLLAVAGSSQSTPRRFVAEEDLRIGSLDADRPYVFGGIAGIATDKQGRMFVAESQEAEIRVFDRQGKHLFSFGRRGAGPGEFVRPCCLAFAPDGRLWVRDRGNTRYVLFSITANSAIPAGVVRAAHPDQNRQAETTFDAAGRLVDVGTRVDSSTGFLRTTRFHVDRSSGEVVQSVDVGAAPESVGVMTRVHVQSGPRPGMYFFSQPYGPTQLFAHAEGGEYAEALSSEYAIRWFSSDGKLLRTIRSPGAQGPELTREQRQRSDSSLKASVVRAGRELPYKTPTRHPPISSVSFDQLGQLWVQRTVASGERRTADVYGRSGTLLKTVSWPASIPIGQAVITQDEIITTGLDADDVPIVVRLRMREETRGRR